MFTASQDLEPSASGSLLHDFLYHKFHRCGHQRDLRYCHALTANSMGLEAPNGVEEKSRNYFGIR